MGKTAFGQIMDAKTETEWMMAMCLNPQNFTEDEQEQIERKAED